MTLLVVAVRMAHLLRALRSRCCAIRQTEALTDPLTGLGNRRRLMHDLDAALKRTAARTLFALFDLDGFKAYNDSFGHPAGDALLRRLGDEPRGRGAAVGLRLPPRR